MNEQAKVGLVVLVSVVLLVAAGFAIANLHFAGQFRHYHAFFKFAGGLEPGAPVRFAGFKVGRINEVRVDPQDPRQVEVMLEVAEGTPIGSDCKAAVTALSMLSENYIEVTPGKDVKPLPEGATLPTIETETLNGLIARMSGMVDSAQPLITDLHKNLNEISAKADTLLANLNQMTGEPNQKHVASALAETDAMIKNNRPKIDAMATNFQSASEEVKPLMADLREASAKLQKVMDSASGMLDENRPAIQASVAELQKTLVATRVTVEQLQSMLTANSDNLDVMIDNFRLIAENFQQFSDIVKQQPSSLIWKNTKHDRKPPVAGSRNVKGGKDEHQ